VIYIRYRHARSFDRSVATGGVDLEENPAIHQQGEKR